MNFELIHQLVSKENSEPLFLIKVYILDEQKTQLIILTAEEFEYLTSKVPVLACITYSRVDDYKVSDLVKSDSDSLLNVLDNSRVSYMYFKDFVEKYKVGDFL